MLNDSIQQAVACLQQGGVIAYPTEAVWGVGCDPFNAEAMQRLLSIKARHPNKGVILIAADFSQVQDLIAPLSPAQQQRLADTWPGPNTWLVPPSDRVPALVKGQHPLVAIRVTAHPLVQALCQAFGGPIISTSANPAGEPPALSEADIARYFPTQLDYVLSGELGGLAQPSTIRNLLTGDVIRP